MDLEPGDVWWAAPDPAPVGREQAGQRPVVVISNRAFHALATTLVMVVPVTTTDRRWLNHVELPQSAGLGRVSFAMTEQVRTISRERLLRRVGSVSSTELKRMRELVAAFIEA